MDYKSYPHYMNTKEQFLEETFKILRENPGIERAEWADAMASCYPELVKELLESDRGTLARLEDFWDCEEYTDPVTGISLSIDEWASFLAGNNASWIYDELRLKIQQLSTLVP